ncbi:MAG: hypothetical protein HY700_11305 [Gemmatimonadetes bacterium]|nr:hypothetical protein [Gemmatimonadota bacterium]
MTRSVRVVGGGMLALCGLVALGWLSRLPYTTQRDSGALVRLAWRTRGERVRECRHRTPEELAKLPPHMREDDVCEGRVLPYRLVVKLDDTLEADAMVRASGAREDRPIYVYHEFPLAPGTHRVSIDFERQGAPGEVENEERAEHEREETGRAERARRAEPGRLQLDTTLVLSDREIALVTYNADERRLVIREK